MRKTKTLRRRCASESCRKVFRHADPAAKVCSPACRQRVYRVRRKAAEEAEQQRVQAELRDRAATLLARMKARQREQPAPEPLERNVERKSAVPLNRKRRHRDTAPGISLLMA